MPRIRSVHPDICTDEVIALIDAESERLFVRLWTHLDDEGRCVDSPRLIRAALFPLLDEVSVEQVDFWLDVLADAGLIRRYGVAGRYYLTAKPDAWGRWQKPRRKVESKLPASSCADIVGTPRDNRRHRPPVVGGGGGDVVGEGVETETEKEGESEGEAEHHHLDPQAVNIPKSSTPLRERLSAIEAHPPQRQERGESATLRVVQEAVT